MKNVSKKLLCLVLAAVMLFALGSTAFAATADNVKQYNTYVCMGDSIAAGFGPYAPSTRGWEKIPAAYHSYVADAVGAKNFWNTAYCGTRTEELRWLLEDDFEGDDVVLSFNGLNWFATPEWDAFMGYDNWLKSYYRGCLSGADLVTLEVGENDVILYATLQTMSVLYADYGDSAFVKQMKELLGNQETYGQALDMLFSAANTADKMARLVSTFLEKLQHGYEHFFQNWEPLINDIKKYAPDADLVCVGLYNPMNEVKLTDQSLLTVGKAVTAMVLGVNAYIAQKASSLGYYYADVMGTDLCDPVALTDATFMTKILTDCHPSEEGHKQMAQKILAVLPTEQEMKFLDVPQGSWYYNGVYYAWANGLMNGMTENLFVPVEIASRAQIATVLYRMAGSPDVSGMTEPFTDVSDSFWAHDAIVWAYNEGVVNGMGDNLFAPLAPVSRAQFVTMLYRYAGSPDVSEQTEPFADVAPGHWAADAIVWAYNNDIVNGVTAHTFVPAGAVTRAQIAVLLARYNGAQA